MPLIISTPKSTAYRDRVQDLNSFGSDQGVQAGMWGQVSTGRTYRCLSVAASTSVWAPTNGIFHVRDFGAIMDNAADDTAAFQAWLDAMNVLNSVFGGGAEGCVDWGDARITAQLNGYSNLVIRGQGRLVSRLRADNVAGFALLDFTGRLNVVIESLGFEGDGQSLAGGVGVNFNNTSQSFVRDLDVRTLEKGIVFGSGSEDCRAEECFATACTTPFEASDSSNDCHFILCRSVNALNEHLLLDGVSQCTGQQCSFQISGTEKGVTFGATNNDNIACGVYETRTEGTSGVGYDFQPGVNTIAYPTIQDPYWTGGITPVTNWNAAGVIDPRVINRARYWEPIIQADPYLINPGDEAAKLKWHNEGAAGAATEPKCLDPREHNPNTGVTGDPVILRRNIAHLYCGADNQSTGAGPVYQAFQEGLGSTSLAGARVQIRMPFAGRCLGAGVIANADHGSTDFEVWVNDVEVASDTQNLGNGRANGATFRTSTNPADQHWAAGDYVTFALDTATTLTNPVTICNVIVEFDMRTTDL